MATAKTTQGSNKKYVAKTQAQASPKSLVGVKGWLLFYAVTLVIGVVVNIGSIFTDNISSSDCALLNSSFNGLCNTLQPFIGFENIAVFIIACLLIVQFTFIIRHKKIGIKFGIAIEIIMVVWGIIDLLLAQNIFGNAFGSYQSAFNDEFGSMAAKMVVGSIVSCCVWIPYLLKSQRVKNTLTE